jgi:hypothetical protein
MELNTFHATSVSIFIYNTWKTLYKEETRSEFQHMCYDFRVSKFVQ